MTNDGERLKRSYSLSSSLNPLDDLVGVAGVGVCGDADGCAVVGGGAEGDLRHLEVEGLASEIELRDAVDA